MNYYCEHCGSTLKIPERSRAARAYAACCPECPVCRELEGKRRSMRAFPCFETPDAYQARTGAQWPEDAPVWFRHCPKGLDIAQFDWWKVSKISALDMDYYKARETYEIFCVQGAEVPEDGWMVEEEI